MIYGPNELLTDVQHQGLCIGCGACIDLCPYFRTYRGKTAMLFPCSSEQGRCHAYCPKTEVDLDGLSERVYGTPYNGKPLGEYRTAYMARAGRRAPGSGFQDGGTVSALMAFALAKGHLDAAVLTGREGLVAVPGLVTEPDQVVSYAASKYMAAPTVSALNKGIREGYRRIGFVGTPCQLTAVAQMRSNPLQAEQFTDPVALTVGLFCTWALDTRSLMAYLQTRTDISSIRKMKIPPPPAEIMVLETETGDLEIPLAEIRALVPDGCGICPDMTAEWGDLSVGAMEGRAEWNTLLVRTEKGEEIVTEAIADDYLRVETLPAESLNHLATAAGNKKRRALGRAVEDGSVNCTEEGRHATLRMRPEVLERLISD